MTPEDYIDIANQWFSDHLPELLQTHRGKWIVIFGNESIGVFDSFSEAYRNGIKTAKSEKIVVREIREEPEKPREISINATLGIIDAGPSISL
jgi:hypothetical protein